MRVGRSRLIWGLKGVRSLVSSLTGVLRILRMWCMASCCDVGFVSVCVVGWVCVWVRRAKRRSKIAMLRRVRMSLLTVLGQNVLRFIRRARLKGALVGKSFVAIRSPSAKMSWTASAIYRTYVCVEIGTFSPACLVCDGVSSVAWRVVMVALSCPEMPSVVFPISSFHWVSRVWGMGN